MSIIDTLGQIIRPVTSLIDGLTTTKEEKLKLKNALKQIELQAYEKMMDYETKLLTAQAGVVRSETRGESWLQRNWRPMLMCTFIIIIFNNYVLAPYLKAIFGWSVMLDLPKHIWTAITVGMGGYIVGRSGEKIAKDVTVSKELSRTLHIDGGYKK